MKAMVLAAGLGVRMRPLTRLLAKPALPVLNRPLLHWTFEALARHGVREVMVNLHHLPESVKRVAGDGRGFGLRVSYSWEPRILGTGGGPRRVRDFFGGEPFLLVNGDVAFDLDLGRLVTRQRASGAPAVLGLVTNPDPRRYTPVRVGRAGRVLGFGGERRGGWVGLFTGAHVMDPALLERLPTGRSDSVRDLYAPLVASGAKLLGVRLTGAWYDLGNPSAYLASQRSMLARGFRAVARGAGIDPRARVAPDARVSASVIGAHCVVAPGALVEDSVLWEDVRVGEGAAVRRSILATGVRVRPGEILQSVAVVPAGRRRGFAELG